MEKLRAGRGSWSNGRIREHETYGMPPTKTHPERSPPGTTRRYRKSPVTGNVQIRCPGLANPSDHVFGNCPFDDDYQPNVDAIGFANTYLGFVAHSARE